MKKMHISLKDWMQSEEIWKTKQGKQSSITKIIDNATPFLN
jgi:hypothetical protein